MVKITFAFYALIRRGIAGRRKSEFRVRSILSPSGRLATGNPTKWSFFGELPTDNQRNEEGANLSREGGFICG